MAKTPFRRLFLALATLCLGTSWLVANAAAAPAQGSLTLSPPGLVEGRLTLAMANHSFVAAYGTRGDADVTLQIETDDLILRRHDSTDDYVYTHNLGIPVPDSQRVSFTPIQAGAARLGIRQVEPNLTIVVQPLNEARLSAAEFKLLSPLDRVHLTTDGPHGETLEPYTNWRDGWPNRYVLRAPGVTHHMQTPGYELDYQGPFFLLISGAQVEIRNATGTHILATGSWEEPAPDDPTGATTMRWRSHHATLIGNLTGHLRMGFRGPYGHVAFPWGSLDGITQLSAPLADASFTVDRTRYEFQNESHLDLEGTFRASFSAPSQTGPGSPIGLRIDGDVVRVMENRVLARDFDRSPAVMAATAAGLSLLAAVFVVVSFVRRGIAYVASQFLFIKWLLLAPLSARLEPGRILEQPQRRAILEVLREHGSMWRLSDFRRAAGRALDLAPNTVLHHLRHLHAGGHVAFYRGQGRDLWVGVERKQRHAPWLEAVLGFLQRPAPMALVEEILAHPGASQEEVCSRVQRRLGDVRDSGGRARVPTRWALVKWLRKLEAFRVPAKPSPGGAADARTEPAPGEGHALLRLIEAQRQGRFVRYRPLPPLVEAWTARGKESVEAAPGLRRLSPPPSNAPSPPSPGLGLPAAVFAAPTSDTGGQ